MGELFASFQTVVLFLIVMRHASFIYIYKRYAIWFKKHNITQTSQKIRIVFYVMQQNHKNNFLFLIFVLEFFLKN